MDTYIQKVVEAIKNSTKPSGKTISKIHLPDNLVTKYNCQDTLTVCYMIANEIFSIPKCLICDNNVSFKSTTKGFAKYCSVNCSTTHNNKKTNYIKNLNRSIQLQRNREDVLLLAKEDYINNDIKISDVATKYSLPYHTVRKFLHDNGHIKKRNQSFHKTKNFIEGADKRLFDKEYLLKCSVDKLSLKDVAKILNVSPNTVRLYAMKHNIEFDSDSQAERELLCFVRNYDTNANKTRQVIKPYEIDIFSEKYNMGIELHGEYWHCENNVDIQYHLKKHKLAETVGIKLIQIYLHEWKNKKEILESMISSNMGSSERIFARKLKFAELDKRKAKVFFEKNHLQGWLKCKFVYGLVDAYGEIYSAISFGKSRFHQDCDYELLRYCNKLHHNVIGGFTKLMKNSQKLLKYKSIITYSHRRLFTGKVYEKFGFTKINETRPGYFWYNLKTKDIRSRYSTQKHKLNTNLSEIEYMKNTGYRRVFDCGQNVYKYTLNI